MNNSNESFELPLNKFLCKQGSFFVISLHAVAYLIQFLSCVIGNSLNLYILPRIRQAEDYIIFAFCILACSDLLQAFLNMPLHFMETIFYDWFIGDFLCKFSFYITHVNQVAGIWIIVYIAFDRYINICHADSFTSFKTEKCCASLLCCISVGQFLIFLFLILSLKTEEDTVCHCLKCVFILSASAYKINGIVIGLLYAYLLPLTFMLFFYCCILKNILNFHYTFRYFLKSIIEDETTAEQSENLSVIKVLLFLIVFFIISNFPNFILVLINVIYFNETFPPGYEGFAEFALFMKTINSCMNPWIFWYYSHKYRYEFMMIIDKLKQPPAIRSSALLDGLYASDATDLSDL